jgi:AcrR family transcriptional regulator
VERARTVGATGVRATAVAPGGRRYRLNEDEMLDAACAVFAAEGYDAAKMETIAARAGTTKPTLYARFGPKDKLFAATVRREHQILNERVVVAYQGNHDESFRVSLQRWTAVYFDFVRERPDGFKLTFEGERHTAAAAAIAEATNERIDSIAELISRVSGRPNGAGPRMVASMIVGMMRWCAQEAIRQPGTNLDDAAALCDSMLYQAMISLDLDLMETVSKRRRPRARKAV